MDHSFSSPSDQECYQTTIDWIQKRGVRLEEVAELTYFLQKDYLTGIALQDCLDSVKHVLTKREVQNAAMTGIQLDLLAEKKQIEEPLLSMLKRDEGLYGIDEVLATAILNVYGSIGLTNYGYIDRIKPGVLGRLNNHQNGQIHTFLDDIIGAIAASASARLAHRNNKARE
ncbi:phosphatidylglycerophosphatase A family protein [Thermoactinomyces mirandus]|uniref:Phosphatidylglycerophosphatase A n=1 Tax=Thermoactinomyces mirandus TaxID=2756294 RepID=A0A7W1XT92_9BACL|nr:phosphatidylglycerophosphatase A [Thermoactinomyces mirandus]MBA4602761.1 phosphatidylglycerophosphatase A [Thermoactinomyces mirandus]